jgi:hypothetical protein
LITAISEGCFGWLGVGVILPDLEQQGEGYHRKNCLCVSVDHCSSPVSSFFSSYEPLCSMPEALQAFSRVVGALVSSAVAFNI